MINDPSQITQQVVAQLPNVRNPYYFARNVLTPYECESLWKTYWETDHIFSEKVSDESSPWYKYFRELRARQHMFIDEPTAWLDDIVDYQVKKANAENFFLDISFGLMSKQLIRYTEADFFSEHDDTNHWDNHYYDRKLTVIIQLSQANSYAGGHTLVEQHLNIKQPDHQKEIGSILIFPTFAIHEVEPITEGERKAFICWYGGPKFR
tara:strand:- start:12144 stop:12767 length:624 start_codon:yes stop_codon:yes gene_type:complete